MKTTGIEIIIFMPVGESQALFVGHFQLFSLVPKSSVENRLGERYSSFRPFHPREAPRYGAEIYRNGTGLWFYRTQDKKGDLGFLSQSPFRFDDEQTALEFLQLPHAKFLSLCAQQWNSPASEMRASYEFDQLSLMERDAQVLRCENGDAGELRRLMNLLGHLIWSEIVRLDYQFDGGYENSLWLEWQSDELFDSAEDAESNSLNRLYNSWRSAIFRVIDPRYIGRESPAHVKHWLEQERHALVCVIESPSHHELLEAQLQLRQWARENLSLAEQNELALLKL